MMVEFCVDWGEIPGGDDNKCKGPAVETDLMFLRNACEASMALIKGKRSCRGQIQGSGV